MDQRIFNRYRSFVHEKCGIALGEGKEAPVSARLGKRMRALGIADYGAYLKHVQQHDDDGELTYLLNAISTNFTSFYRESAHFERLTECMARWLAAGQTRFRVWCAASSTGEEPYTLAMTLREAASGRNLDMRILATDIATDVLQTAAQGVYDKDRAKSVPPLLRERYFERVGVNGAACHRALPELREMIAFQRLNLSTPPFPMRGPFDVVFCRNVMIYFDNQVRKRLLDEIYRLLRPGGYLMVGHAESLTSMIGEFRLVSPSVYTKD